MLELSMKVPGPYTEIPLLVVHEPRADGYRGTVLHFHGLHEAKERYQDALHAMAKRGYLAIGVDSIAHGERRAWDFEEQVQKGYPTILRWAEETAREIPSILDAITALVGPERAGRVAVSGVSMGGYVAYAAGAREPRVSTVVSILGCPDWSHGGKYPDAERLGASPHRAAEKLAPRPLLAINCELDESVPPVFARRFVEALRPHYAAAPDSLAYVEYPRWGHLLSPDHWKDVWKRTLDWLDLHLAK
jgi:dienelactone hydrolase